MEVEERKERSEPGSEAAEVPAGTEGGTGATENISETGAMITRALISEIQDQHTACLERIDRGLSLHEDILTRIAAIQVCLNSSAGYWRSEPAGAFVQDDARTVMPPNAPKDPTAKPPPEEQLPAWRKNPAARSSDEQPQKANLPGAYAEERTSPVDSARRSLAASADEKKEYVSLVDSARASLVSADGRKEDTSPVESPRSMASAEESADGRKDAAAKLERSPTSQFPLQKIAAAARKKLGIEPEALPLLPAILGGDQEETLASGKPLRSSIHAVRKQVGERGRRSSNASLIMPPGATDGTRASTGTASGFHDAWLGRVHAKPPGFGPVTEEEHPQRRYWHSVSEMAPVLPGEIDGDGTSSRTSERRPSSDNGSSKAAGEEENDSVKDQRERRKAGRDMFVPISDSKPERFWSRIATHSFFDISSGLLIVASTAIAGVEAEYMAQHRGQTHDTFNYLRYFFLACFSVELVLRMLDAGLRGFFTGKDRGWNIFDFIMVGASLFEIAAQLLDGGGTTGGGTIGGSGSSRILRILRIVRISRALRLGRVLRYARTFRQIVYSLQSSVTTLFWAMVMIFLVVYCFAICFCQAWSEFLLDPEIVLTARDEQELFLLYSSLGRSLYSLFMAMTGGRSWGELLEPLMDISEMYTALFVLFVSLTFFGVLNIVAAIFVDSAMQSQQHYKDLLIQENLLKKEVYSQHLREVFHAIDRDRSGVINGDEMEFFLSDPSLNLYLESIDIFPNDARSLFRLLDRDGSGEVSIDEFCQGCLRLKGEAKSFDIHCLIYASDRSQRKLDQIINWMTTAVPMDDILD